MGDDEAKGRRPAGKGPRPNLALAEELRRRLAEHEIPPGAKLKEQEIAREFGVSRTRVREAMARLELDGLVEHIPNRGVIARKLELNQVFEIYDVREVLEGLAIRQAVRNENPEIWQDFLDTISGDFEARVTSGEIELYEQEFSRFRAKVITAARNPVLTRMLDSVQDQTRIIMRRVLVLPGRADRGLKDWRLVLEAMRAGKADEAEHLRRNSIRGAIESLRRYQGFVL